MNSRRKCNAHNREERFLMTTQNLDPDQQPTALRALGRGGFREPTKRAKDSAPSRASATPPRIPCCLPIVVKPRLRITAILISSRRHTGSRSPTSKIAAGRSAVSPRSVAGGQDFGAPIHQSFVSRESSRNLMKIGLGSEKIDRTPYSKLKRPAVLEWIQNENS